MAKWKINPTHSSATFDVRHMMVSWVHGMFGTVTGTLNFDPLEVERAAVAVEIDAASIYSGVEQRDGHLKSADFLEVEKYPVITFKSTRVEPDGLDRALVHGDLTIRGVTRPVALEAYWAGPFSTMTGKSTPASVSGPKPASTGKISAWSLICPWSTAALWRASRSTSP